MKNGFTLIELLVVVLIIGILAAIALPQYEMSVAKSRLQEAIVNSKALKGAQDRYFLATGAYPDKFELLDVAMPDSVSSDAQYGTDTITWGNFIYQLATGNPSFIRASGGPGLLAGLIFHVRNNGEIRCYASKNTSRYDKHVKVCLSLGGVRYPSGDTENHEAYRV